MRTAASAVALALVVVVAPSCGTKKGPEIERAALSRLVLQRADLPGFERFDEGPQAQVDAHPGPRADAQRFGRVGGWKARYKRPAAETTGALVVESRADLFDGDDGAEKDLDAYRQELGASARLADVPGLGDDAVATRSRVGKVVFFTVAWRSANATASVAANGFAGSLRMPAVVALARKQQQRVERAA